MSRVQHTHASETRTSGGWHPPQRYTRGWFLLVPALALLGCASPRLPENPPLRFPAPERIVAIGDLHGDLEATREALKVAGAIDEADRWTGGDLVVVQTGDVLDRGGDEQAIIDLFARLEVEAARSGGAFHALNGNHELMNSALDLRYVTDEGYRDFEDAVEYDPSDSTLASYEPHQRARVAALRPGGRYARIMARRNVITIIGENLFVHGGVLPAHVDRGLEQMNQESRNWLRGEGPKPEWMGGRESPEWSRHYSNDPDEEDEVLLEEVFERLGVKRMIVGHTVYREGITSLLDGRVWCIDVGLAALYGGPMQVLEIRGDEVRVLKPSG